MTKPLALTAAAAAALTLTAFAAACPASAQGREALIQAAVAAPDRPQGDTDRDHRRRPAITLEISPVQPGDDVLDLSAGGGYMTRLYSSLVGPDGHATAQNPPSMMDRAPQIADALAAMADERGNVSSMVADAGDLDAPDGAYDVVAITLSYHDRVNAGDTEAMDREVFRVLKPGGAYFIVDHNAEAGSGTRDTSTLHRIDKEYVRAQVEAAGFTLDRESHAMENPDDPLTGRNRMEEGSSQFAYVFVKPAS